MFSGIDVDFIEASLGDAYLGIKVKIVQDELLTDSITPREVIDGVTQIDDLNNFDKRIFVTTESAKDILLVNGGFTLENTVFLPDATFNIEIPIPKEFQTIIATENYRMETEVGLNAVLESFSSRLLSLEQL
ncbi:MAG: hypothetical protein ACRC8A_07600 [Microcoleaceae cyanobacterium]